MRAFVRALEVEREDRVAVGVDPVAAIEDLVAQEDSTDLGNVLADAYLSAGAELRRDGALQQQVLKRIAPCPNRGSKDALGRFPDAEVAPFANAGVGEIQGNPGQFSVAYGWLHNRPAFVDLPSLQAKLRAWRTRTSHQLTELMYLAHANAPDDVLADLARQPDLYTAAGPKFLGGLTYTSQAEIALIGLGQRGDARRMKSAGSAAAMLQILRTLVELGSGKFMWTWPIASVVGRLEKTVPHDPETWPEFKSLATRLAKRIREEPRHRTNDEAFHALNAWADRLETAIAKRDRDKQKRKPKRAAKKAKSPAGKKKAKSSAKKKRTKRR
ncbi:MAG: hypothetical protein IID40_11640 [Planctomycetes bacterium]|nr:hypothetical protein [Planctomycetota bacterium]